MLKLFICDDDHICLEQSRELVQSWAEKNDRSIEIQTFDNGDSLLIHHKKEQADIIILDIMMPLLNGMDTAREIRKTDAVAKLIFLTSSPEFAVESYDVKASGYLLKPIHQEKLESLLSECSHETEKEPNHIIIRTLGGYQKIYLHTIECIEAQSRKVIFHLNNGTEAEALGTFSSYADALSPELDFYKCHRSYIVNIRNIDHFSTSEIMTQNGQRIPIARGLGKAFKDAYFAHMFQKEED